jgi:hypothetical protein
MVFDFLSLAQISIIAKESYWYDLGYPLPFVMKYLQHTDS